MIDWSLYRSFLAVVQTGSLSESARVLRLTQPTLGRHVAALEEALGLALFTRSAQGLTPTEAARHLVPHAEAMAAAAAALERAAATDAQGTTGVVRLTASQVIGAEVLPPLLAQFRTLHPGIVLELVLSDRIEDLLRRDADIAVRMARPSQKALLARQVGTVPLGLFAHRDYLARAGTPASLADLLDHPIIGFDRAAYAARLVETQAGGGLDRSMFALRTDSDLAQLAAIRAGFGIGVAQVGIGRRDPALVHLLPGDFRMNLDMWLAAHEDLKSSRPVRLLLDHLAEGLGRYVAAGRIC